MRQSLIDHAPPSENSSRQLAADAPVKTLCAEVLSSSGFQWFMVGLTVYALFGDDLRAASFPKSADDTFYGLSSAALGCFFFEMLCNWWVRPEYRFGLYFFLDLVSMLSMLPDIGWIPLISTFSSSSLLKTSRASRAGTRAGRVIRLIRLARLLRIGKLVDIQEKRQRRDTARKASIHPGETFVIDADKEDAPEHDPEEKGEPASDELRSDAPSSESQSGVSPEHVLQRDGSASLSRTYGQRLRLLKSSASLRGAPQKGPAVADADADADADAVRDKSRRSKDAAASDGEASDVGKKLMELTTRKVLLIGLFLILIVPFLESSFWTDDAGEQSIVSGLDLLHRLSQDGNATGNVTAEAFREGCEHYWRSVGNVLRFRVHGWDEETTNAWLRELRFRDRDIDPFTLPSDPDTGWRPARDMRSEAAIDRVFRATEVLAMSFEAEGCFVDSGVAATTGGCESAVFVDLRDELRRDAIINIIKTLFVIFSLVAAIVLFTRDADTLVVDPIERMTELVKRIAVDPASMIRRNSDRDGSAASLDKVGRQRSSFGLRRSQSMSFGGPDAHGRGANPRVGSDDTLLRAASSRGLASSVSSSFELSTEPETELIERALAKIGGLLQVGFGVAGEKVIARCIAADGGDIDVMLPGRPVTAVIGFGIIADFSAATSCLKEDVILYANLIARIVHRAADMHSGAVNKNLGNAFLCVWKICDGRMPGLRDPRGRFKPAAHHNRSLPPLRTLSMTSTSSAVSSVGYAGTRPAGLGLAHASPPVSDEPQAAPQRSRSPAPGSANLPPRCARHGAVDSPPQSSPFVPIAHASRAGAVQHLSLGRVVDMTSQRSAFSSSDGSLAIGNAGAGPQGKQSPPPLALDMIVQRRGSASPTLSEGSSAAATDTVPSPRFLHQLAVPPSMEQGASMLAEESTPTSYASTAHVIEEGDVHEHVPPLGAHGRRRVQERHHGHERVGQPPRPQQHDLQLHSLQHQNLQLHNQQHAQHQRPASASQKVRPKTRGVTPTQRIEASLAAIVKVLNDIEWLQREQDGPAVQGDEGTDDAAAERDECGEDLDGEEAFETEDQEVRRQLLRLTKLWAVRERSAAAAAGTSHPQSWDAKAAGAPPGHRKLSNHRQQQHQQQQLQRRACPQRKRCAMGFGLHIGWAIEGSIGSRYKVDMSYLSPNVNLAARLEAATAQFRCPLLVSGFLMDEVSHATRDLCRLVDVVTVKGSQIPIELWTFDIHQSIPDCLDLPANLTLNGNRRRRGRVYVDFSAHPDVHVMAHTRSKERHTQIAAFRACWHEAMHAYVSGDWPECSRRLDEAEAAWPGARDDGPLQNLRSVIRSHGGEAPESWPGYRKLTSK